MGSTTPGHEECERESRLRIEAVHKALADHQEPCAIEQWGHRLPTKVVVVAEYIDEQGERDLVAHVTQGMTAWDVRGFLKSVLS